jgi:hypothetical protein
MFALISGLQIFIKDMRVERGLSGKRKKTSSRGRRNKTGYKGRWI